MAKEDVLGRVISAVSGETVIVQSGVGALISGQTVVVASGLYVLLHLFSSPSIQAKNDSEASMEQDV